MGKRIVKGGRRYGRDNTVVAGLPSTHKIAIGYNAGTEGQVKPGKLNGFLIFLDTLGQDNKLVVDYAAMERLGSTRPMVEQAMKGGEKADPELLPRTLRFVVMSDAVMDEGGQWSYPGTYAASYECYNKIGLWCSGDGQHAQRKMPDGSKRALTAEARSLTEKAAQGTVFLGGCNPYGKEGVSPGDYCPYSGPGNPCKLHLRLTVSLYYYAPQDHDADGAPLIGARPRLVSPALGWQARYRFDTSSEYCDIAILDVLDAAAARVRGRLNGITGTLTHTRRGRRTGSEQGVSKSITGFVVFNLDEHSIRAREAQIAAEENRMFDRQLEAGKAGVPLQIAAPVTVHEPVIDVTPTSTIAEEAADPFDAPAPPDGFDSDYDPQNIDPDPREGLVAPEMAETRNAPVTLETATDPQLADALRGGLEEFSGGDPKRYADELNDLTFGHPDGYQTKTGRVQVGSVDWFFQGAGDKDALRRKMLREACVKASRERGWNLFDEEGSEF